MLPSLCIAVILIYEPHGATYGQRCPTIPPADQSVYVRSPQEIEFEAKRILAMKADALGVPIDKLKKCYVIENNQRRWHMWEKCK